MKTIKIIYIVTGIALLFMVSGCSDDFLNLEPKINKLEGNSYKTEEDAMNALAAVYDVLSVQNWCPVFINSDIFSDDANAAGEPGSGMQEWQEQETSIMNAENNASANLWSRCYSGNYRANVYLQKEQVIEWTNDAKRKRMKAEVLTLRAYFYWDLVRHFGYVPLVTDLLPDTEEYKKVPQATPQDVYMQITTDLLAAIPDLPESVPITEAGRITKDVARVLLGRVYMFYNDFVMPVMGATENLTDGTTLIDENYVQAMLDEIITSKRYRLLDDYNDVFDWGNENNEESIFEWQYSALSQSNDWGGWGVNGNFSVVFYGIRDPAGDTTIQSGWSFATATWSLVDEFEPGDPRLNATIYNANDSLISYTKGFQNTGYFHYKYMPRAAYDPSLNGGEKNHNWPINFKDMRLAEVYLMAAELFLDDNPGKALDYLNEVRTRSMGDGAALTAVTLDAIYHEKRVELAGEGKRKWDLLRRGLDYAKEKIDASWIIPPGADVAEEEFSGRQFITNTWGMIPLPASEIRLAEPGLLQQKVPAFVGL